MTSSVLGFFILSLLLRGIDATYLNADTKWICEYLCRTSQCPNSCRMQVGMKWSRRSVINFNRNVMESKWET